MARGDGELPKINLNSFLGGESTDFKTGGVGGFYSSQAMDFRQKASQMTVLPALYNVTNQLQDLPLAMEQDPNGVRYMCGDKGYVYRISTSNVVSQVGQLTSAGAAGMFYNQPSDLLYIAGQQTISILGPLTNSNQGATLMNDQFGKSASVANSVTCILNTSTNAYDAGVDTNTTLTTQRNNLASLTATGVIDTSNVTNISTNTYSVPTTLSESSGNYASFVPDITPFYSVSVYIGTKGTGNWTLTMHDSLNHNLGTVPISNGSINANSFNEFVFTSPGINAITNSLNSINGSSYHFHLTSSVADGKVPVISSGNLNGCNFVLFVYRLIKQANGWHPMAFFNNLLLIGNANTIATYNGGNDVNPNNNQFVRHALVLDTGYNVTGITPCGQYAVIFAEKRSNNTSRNYQGGFIYLWDGVSAGYLQRVPIAMGAPYSPFTQNNVVYFYCGGSLFAWTPGGTTIIKVRYMAYQNTDYLGTTDHTVVNPNMMASRYNLLLLGYPSITTNTNVNYGIYSWGAVELTWPNSFGYSYVPSHGIQNYTSANNLQTGMIYNFVDSLYLSWTYTDANSVQHWGLDVMDNTSSVAPTFKWASLIWDGGVRYKMKKGLRFKISTEALPTGVTLTPWYSIDRGAQIIADPASGTPFTVGAGSTNVLINIPNARSHELQWGFNGTATPGTVISPVITGVTAEIDALDDEPDLRADG